MKRVTKMLQVVMMLGLVLASGWAAAAANLEVDTPAIVALQRSQQARHAQLAPYYQSGAVGLTRDGLIAVRDASLIPLPQRQSVSQWVADENRDRIALYREIARANGHPEWEAEIRSTFAERWIQKAPGGWWVQNGRGEWVKK
jgi:uncharacterized protein YdbL (DUF1318 family)